MTISLSSDDVGALQSVNEALLSPLVYPSLEQWQEATLARLMKVFRADAAGFVPSMSQMNVVWTVSGIDPSFRKEYLDHYQYVDETV